VTRVTVPSHGGGRGRPATAAWADGVHVELGVVAHGPAQTSQDCERGCTSMLKGEQASARACGSVSVAWPFACLRRAEEVCMDADMDRPMDCIMDTQIAGDQDGSSD
jgi:hypothetical protein